MTLLVKIAVHQVVKLVVKIIVWRQLLIYVQQIAQRGVQDFVMLDVLKIVLLGVIIIVRVVLHVQLQKLDVI